MIDCMQTAYGYAIRNINGDQASSITEESVECQHSYSPNDDKTWCKYHKDKILNTNIYMIGRNVYHLC